jgi:hypothetical protein
MNLPRNQIRGTCGIAALVAGVAVLLQSQNVADRQNVGRSQEEVDSAIRTLESPRHSELEILTSPFVTLTEREQVQSADVMAFNRSMLVEEGECVDRIRRSSLNLTIVRRDVNDFVTGYALPVERSDGVGFSGETIGFRATALDSISVWPPKAYPAAREETRTHASGLEPISVRTSQPRQLRLYHFPIRVGHNGDEYHIEDSLLAFFVHPVSGSRMTAMHHRGKTWAAVNEPLVSTVRLAIAETERYSALLGLGKVHVPAKFFAESVEFGSGSLDVGHPLSRCLEDVLAAWRQRESGHDVRSLTDEMLRFTELFENRTRPANEN